MSKLALSLTFCTVLAVAGFSQTPPKKTPAPVTCPVCHMPLSLKKTADNTVAVKLTKKGKTYYCCTKCTMPADVLVKTKPAPKPKS